MYIVLTIALCLFSITFHELGHAWACYTLRVPIKTISLLGMKLPFLPSLTWWVRIPRQRRPVRVQLHPFLVGAYMLPEQFTLKKLGARDQAFIFGAGPFASLLYSIAMLVLSIGTHAQEYYWWVVPVWLGIMGLMIVFRKIFCRYIVLALGVALMGLVVYGMLSHPETAASSMGGPVTLVQQSTRTYAQGSIQHHELRTAFLVAAQLSFFIGMGNAIPLVPFDGGHIARIYLAKLNARIGRYYTVAGLASVLVLLSMAFSSDLKILLRALHL